MFKELGAFIDEAARFTGRVIKEKLSDKYDDDGGGTLTGCVVTEPRPDLFEFEDKSVKVITGSDD